MSAYLVQGTYKGDTVGFRLLMKSAGGGVIRFISTGEPSDRFLRVLQGIFKLEVDKMSHFADTVKADCLSMKEYQAALGKGGYGDGSTTDQYKLFFAPKDAACYLNIIPAAHYIELVQKDEEDRGDLVSDMSRKK